MTSLKPLNLPEQLPSDTALFGQLEEHLQDAVMSADRHRLGKGLKQLIRAEAKGQRSDRHWTT